MSKRILATGNQNGIVAVACPKCDAAMQGIEGGHSETFIGGMVSQVEYSAYWQCPACGYVMSESEPEPMTEEDWEALFAGGGRR